MKIYAHLPRFLVGGTANKDVSSRDLLSLSAPPQGKKVEILGRKFGMSQKREKNFERSWTRNFQSIIR